MSLRAVKIGWRTHANDLLPPARARTITSSAPISTDRWLTKIGGWQRNCGVSRSNPDGPSQAREHSAERLDSRDWPPGWISEWWSRLVSNQRPSACEADLAALTFCLRWSEACRWAELDPLEHLV